MNEIMLVFTYVRETRVLLIILGITQGTYQWKASAFAPVPTLSLFARVYCINYHKTMCIYTNEADDIVKPEEQSYTV